MIRFAIAAVAAALIASPALAADTDAVNAKVKTSDLNLQSESGAKTALQRINRAAKTACSDVTVGSRVAQVDKACVSDVTDKLIKQLKAPLVEAAYSAQKTERVSQG